MAYWVSEKLLRCYENKIIYDYAKPCKGIDTGNNDVFLRLWHEVEETKMFMPRNVECTLNDFQKNKWFPYNKGGNYRKWFGNNEYVINWDNNGRELKTYRGSNLRNKECYFNRGITWSTVTSGESSFRFFSYGFLFDNGGSSLFSNDLLLYIDGFLNSHVSQELLKTQPTMNTQPGTIGALPLIVKNKELIETNVTKNIAISQKDWNSFETSWDFKKHPLI